MSFHSSSHILFLFWCKVDEIELNFPSSDMINFQVGLINKRLDAGRFKTVHSCHLILPFLINGLGTKWFK
ncbi:hypothetical protein CISIN_1g044145mg [Citrus sinensis]|uniref:Uncharacterized protein n=1 Tax=Citrus sinensis TaxID=2711 RepID=A0A067DF08_CITSI|nr:hypothetical protein CISIN_1g044145mg [Citrus sinensis]